MYANARISISDESGHINFTATYGQLLTIARRMIAEGDDADRYDGMELLDSLYRL